MKALMTLLVLVSFLPAARAAKLQVLELETPFRGSRLYVPNDGVAHPGIVVLHGSEGGSMPFYRKEALLLASHGFAALAYCWYDCDKFPITDPVATLADVNLDDTYRALVWLKSSPHVHGGKTALVGTSRGAEQALILGWRLASERILGPDAIAVHAGSDVVVSGFTWAALDRRCWVCTSFDLACFNGSADPAKWSWQATRWNPSCGAMPTNPATNPIPAWKWHGQPLATDTRIAIEAYTGPIFLTHGTKDTLWDSGRTERLQATLVAAGRRPEVHFFPGEGHVFQPTAENQRLQLLVDFLEHALR